MLNPKGSIVRTMRLRETDTTEDGSEITRMISGAGVVVHIKPDVPGWKPSDVRRAFTRAAKALGVITTVVERAHGYFSQTGKPIAEALPSAFQCVGPVPGLQQLVRHFAVSEWHFAVGVRVPVVAGGNGPEKVRPSSGTLFGKPDTVKRTGEVLAKQTADHIAMSRKAYAAAE
jgi:hypothetical protein